MDEALLEEWIIRRQAISDAGLKAELGEDGMPVPVGWPKGKPYVAVDKGRKQLWGMSDEIVDEAQQEAAGAPLGNGAHEVCQEAAVEPVVAAQERKITMKKREPNTGYFKNDHEELMDMTLPETYAELDDGLKKITASQRRMVAMKRGPVSSFGKGEDHHNCKYSDEMVRGIRAVHREMGRQAVEVLYGSRVPKASLENFLYLRGYRKAAVPTEDDYARARMMKEQKIGSQIDDAQEAADQRAIGEWEVEKALKKKGIHPSQLHTAHYSYDGDAYAKAGDGKPSQHGQRGVSRVANQKKREKQQVIDEPWKVALNWYGQMYPGETVVQIKQRIADWKKAGHAKLSRRLIDNK